MAQPTSILDTLLNFKRSIVGEHVWHTRNCWRRLYIECGTFKLRYTADHGRKREEV